MTSLTSILPTLLRELVDGSPDAGAPTYMLNQGDTGLLASLDRLSASAASAPHHGGASIAAHTDHLRYGLSLLNRWASGAPQPWKNADWTASWKKNVVSDEQWRGLRQQLRAEATAWIAALPSMGELSEREACWVAGSVAHLAYHFGAIRQIDRATRGPTAEDEVRAKVELRAT